MSHINTRNPGVLVPRELPVEDTHLFCETFAVCNDRHGDPQLPST